LKYIYICNSCGNNNIIKDKIALCEECNSDDIFCSLYVPNSIETMAKGFTKQADRERLRYERKSKILKDKQKHYYISSESRRGNV